MKAALTSLVVFGFAMLIGWPWLVGPKPVHPSHKEAVNYLYRVDLYVCVLLIVFFATTVLAIILARRARDEYRQQALNNMRFLIESTLEDHRKKETENPDA